MKQGKYLIFAVVILFVTNFIYAQSDKMDPDTYNSQKNELTIQKENLLKEKNELKNELLELTTKLRELEIKLDAELSKYFIKKYGEEEGSRVAMGQIWKGMTEQMMRDSWGEPDKKNTDRYSYGVFTQYYYGKVIYFFRDNKLIDWEEEK